MRLWAQIRLILYLLIKVKPHLTSRGGVHGIFSYHRQQNQEMVFTPIQTTTFKDLFSTLAIQHAPNTTTPATAVQGHTMIRAFANLVSTVKMQKRCARMPIVMVCTDPRRLVNRCLQSLAFDDQTSTFIIPSGGGFQVIFCPSGRSTNIINTMKPELTELSQTGHVTPQLLADSSNLTLIQLQSKGTERSQALTSGIWITGTLVLLGIYHTGLW